MSAWDKTRRAMVVLTPLLLLGAGLAWAVQGSKVADSGTRAETVARGEYLARAGDCVSCHTVAGGKPLAGGRSIPTPFGTLYTPNITPDRKTGIGDWSDADFRRAMHEGIDADGHYLYPAFPFTSYTRVRREDLDAIWAWLQTLEPVRRVDTPNTLSFPFSWRSLMAGWRLLYFDKGEFQPVAGKSKAYNRGAYLVRGLGHCGDCHTPRNWLGATRDDKYMRGSMIPEQDWYAPGLGTAEGNGLDGWSRQDIVDFLKHGRSARGIAYGPMAEVVRNSTQHLSRTDLEAIATYLLERPSRPSPRADGGLEPSMVEQTREKRLARHMSRGQDIYRKHCADCHGKRGEGMDDVYPALAGNSSLLSPTPVNAIRAVLLGGFSPATEAWPRPYSMPPFIQKMDDAQVADVVTYIRHAWGNRPATKKPHAAVREKTVARYRSAFTHRD